MKYVLLISVSMLTNLICAQEPLKEQEKCPENPISRKLSRIELVRQMQPDKEKVTGELLRSLAYSPNSLRFSRSLSQSQLIDKNARKRSASLATCYKLQPEDGKAIQRLANSDAIKSLPNPESQQ